MKPAPTALLPVMNAFPVPSPNGLEDATNGIGQFIGGWSNPDSLNSTSVRFDHVVNDKLRLFFRFSDTASNSTMRIGTYDDIPAYTLRTYTAGATSVFSSRLSNAVRLNYSSNDVTDGDVIDAFGGSTPVDLAQLARASGIARADNIAKPEALAAKIRASTARDSAECLVLATEPDLDVVRPPAPLEPVLTKHRFMTAIGAPRYVPTLFGGGKLEGV